MLMVSPDMSPVITDQALHRSNAAPIIEGNHEEATLPDHVDYEIPMATLVEENADRKYKLKLLAIAVATFIIAIGIGVGVSVSRKTTETPPSQSESDGAKKITPEEIQAMNNYTIRIRPSEYGGRAYYYGAKCNAFGTACSGCGLYEVNLFMNEVIGTCSTCNVCAGHAVSIQYVLCILL